LTIPKTKKTLTIHIVQEDRDKLEAAVKSLRQRTGEKTSAGKVTRDQLLKWADEELKSQINPFMLEEKKEPEMHADLIWLAENVSKWGGTFGYKHIFLEDGEADYNSEPCNLRKTFTRDQWQAARIELGLENPFAACLKESDDTCASGTRNGQKITVHPSSFTTPEEEEEWIAAEKRMEIIGHNGATSEHCEAPLSKYHVLINGKPTDVYDILVAYEVTNPADAHAIKKMLCPGKRGVKDGIQDRTEAIVSLQRAIELEQGR